MSSVSKLGSWPLSVLRTMLVKDSVQPREGPVASVENEKGKPRNGRLIMSARGNAQPQEKLGYNVESGSSWPPKNEYTVRVAAPAGVVASETSVTSRKTPSNASVNAGLGPMPGRCVVREEPLI